MINVDCVVRLANYNDIDIIYNLDGEYEHDKYSRELIADSVNNQAYINLIAMKGDSPVGYVSVSSVVDESEILKIVVAKDYRQQGIGYTLMCNVLKRLKDNGSKTVFLEVRSENVPAKRLYEKNGFTKIHQRQKYYNDGADADIYRLSLNV